MSFSTGDTVRVVRTNGDVETNWTVCFTFMHGNETRTQVSRYLNEQDDFVYKCPRTAMLEYWQAGGMAKDTNEWLTEIAADEAEVDDEDLSDEVDIQEHDRDGSIPF